MLPGWYWLRRQALYAYFGVLILVGTYFRFITIIPVYHH